MGGFTLIGPTHIFNSCPDSMPCRCTGFKGEIPLDVENILLKKEDKFLDFGILPQDIRDNMMKSHLGSNFQYTVTKRSTQEEKDAKEKQWLLDMVDMRNNIYSEINYSNTTSQNSMFETLSIDNETTIDTKLENLLKERSKTFSFM